MLEAPTIVRMHEETTRLWHEDVPPTLNAGAGSLIEVAQLQHRANFDLWHEEDKARDPSATDADIATVKHSIDTLNQRRNDLVETLDRMLLAAAGAQNRDAPLHSESPGLMIDRLSILALKLYHTAEETRRASAAEAHRQRNRERLALLAEQRADLAVCLDELWVEVLAGRRRFKLYRQMKMYNDPDLNPAVYRRNGGEQGSQPGGREPS